MCFSSETLWTRKKVNADREPLIWALTQRTNCCCQVTGELFYLSAWILYLSLSPSSRGPSRIIFLSTPTANCRRLEADQGRQGPRSSSATPAAMRSSYPLHNAMFQESNSNAQADISEWDTSVRALPTWDNTYIWCKNRRESERK